MWMIPRIIVNRMLGHAQRSLPEECVGILSGQGHNISGCHPLTNQLQDSKKFMAEPSEQIQLLRQLREEGLELTAIYHSHPQSSATPSAADIQQAYYPEALYLIISLQTDGRMEINGYLIQNGQPILQELLVLD